MADQAYITTGRGAHKSLIGDLAKFPEVETIGFFRALSKLPDAPYFTSLLAEDREWARMVKFTPDAYAINNDNWTVTIFEAVASNDITPSKMNKIVELGWALDGDGWALALIRCDLSGRRLYDPIGLYVVEMHDRINSADPVNVQVHKHWQRYTVEYCSARLLSHAQGAPA